MKTLEYRINDKTKKILIKHDIADEVVEFASDRLMERIYTEFDVNEKEAADMYEEIWSDMWGTLSLMKGYN